MMEDDGTAFRDESFRLARLEAQKRNRKITILAFTAVIIFILGMCSQRSVDRYMMNNELSLIETMPEPTEAQKAEARRHIKKVSPKYLSERKPR